MTSKIQNPSPPLHGLMQDPAALVRVGFDHATDKCWATVNGIPAPRGLLGATVLCLQYLKQHKIKIKNCGKAGVRAAFPIIDKAVN